MAQHNTSRRRYRWEIVQFVDGERLGALCTGNRSTEILGDLFAIWTRDRDDLSGWADAPRFGTLVARYSDLTAPAVAVWLGLDPAEVDTPLAPEGRAVPTEDDLSWTFTDPDGHRMRLERSISE